MGKEIVIAGEPIPGDDLGPTESKQAWEDIQRKARTMVGSYESLAVSLAEWWDRHGPDNCPIESPVAYLAALIGCGKSRVYQLISHGRSKWHLYTRVDKKDVDAITEGVWRPALKHNVDTQAEIVQRAREVAEADPKANGHVRTRHVRQALKEYRPESKPRATREEREELDDAPRSQMAGMIAELRSLSTRVGVLAHQTGEPGCKKLTKLIDAALAAALDIKWEAEEVLL